MATPFLRFWSNDSTRERFLSFMPNEDLPAFRLVCYDFGTRAAPHLFEELAVTFRVHTFTKPARLAALERDRTACQDTFISDASYAGYILATFDQSRYRARSRIHLRAILPDGQKVSRSTEYTNIRIMGHYTITC